MKQTKLLCIFDGFGIGDQTNNNAIYKAKTPNYDKIRQIYSQSKIDASAIAVGLPKGQMGNSEVGHLNIGAGRVVKQTLPKIDDAIATNDILTKSQLKEFITKTKQANNICHLLGVLSDGGVHGHINHILALVEILTKAEIKVYIHAILDGRDTAPSSALKFLTDFSHQIKTNDKAHIVSLTGRYYIMDRDNNWDRVKLSYDAIIAADALQVNDFAEYIKSSYDSKITDEFIKPVISKNYQGIKDGDSVFLSNFRADRARQISQALFIKDFNHLDRVKVVDFASQISMTSYSKELDNYLPHLFPVEIPQNTLSEVLSNLGKTQLHIAETEKYAHVTFFFNGGIEKPFKGEDRILIPSTDVATFDLKPEMSAHEVTEKLLIAIESKQYDFIVVNYANPDMVGHTGNFEASVNAIETLDKILGQLQTAILAINGEMILTADHGNIEFMYDLETKAPHTAHTLNFVPFIVISSIKYDLVDGKLCDIAPTVLKLMNITQPKEMSGQSLIKTNE